MASYWLTVTLLCIYGLLKEFRPTEPYLYEYEHVTLNISEQVLNQDVYPIWTYSYLVTLIPAFLLTDVLLYKPVIIFEAISYTIVWLLLVFGTTVLNQQFLELFYGWATATEVAYFAYIYVKVPKEKFKDVTSYTRTALLVGRFTAYSLAQLIILLEWGTYQTLNIISLVAMFLAVAFSVVLPNVSWRIAYERKLEAQGDEEIMEKMQTSTYKSFLILFFRNLYRDVMNIYSDWFILKWSVWWALSNCAFYQVTNYTQTLWGSLPADSDKFNGITEALAPLFGIPVTLLTQKMTVDWILWGELFLALGSLLQGAYLLAMSQTNSIVVMYIGYVLYRTTYQAAMTVAQCNLATKLKSDSFGLLFGLNTFVALLLQTILTICVVKLAKLSIRPQFIVYSSYHLAVTIIFAVPFVAMVLRRSCCKQRHHMAKIDDDQILATQSETSSVAVERTSSSCSPSSKEDVSIVL